MRDEGFCPLYFNVSQWSEHGISMTYHSDPLVGTIGASATVRSGQNQLVTVPARSWFHVDNLDNKFAVFHVNATVCKECLGTFKYDTDAWPDSPM